MSANRTIEQHDDNTFVQIEAVFDLINGTIVLEINDDNDTIDIRYQEVR
jgi:hypothetical protein